MTPLDDMTQLVGFLREQLDLDSGAAGLHPNTTPDQVEPWQRSYRMPGGTQLVVEGRQVLGQLDPGAALHMVRFDARRMLREIIAKRRLLELWDETRALHDNFGSEPGSGAVIRATLNAYSRALLVAASCYADRDGYRPEWRVER